MPSIDGCNTCSHLSAKISAGSASEVEVTKVEKHQEKYRKVRSLYATDADRVGKNTESVYSFDLLKILLLPVMPSSKDAFFISRLVTFNENFTSVGTRNPICPSFCVTWHEAISRRNPKNIANTLHKFI